jgi:hypothetical protein
LPSIVSTSLSTIRGLKKHSIYFTDAAFSEKPYQDPDRKAAAAPMHNGLRPTTLRQFCALQAMDPPSCDGILTPYISQCKTGRKAVTDGIE